MSCAGVTPTGRQQPLLSVVTVPSWLPRLRHLLLLLRALLLLLQLPLPPLRPLLLQLQLQRPWPPQRLAMLLTHSLTLTNQC